MRPNGTDPRPEDSEHGWSRVTSMARWLARRRPAAHGAPAVSVVIPVYNAAATLAECLTRLFQSTFVDFEVVVVDDGSTDQSAAIAANFPLFYTPAAAIRRDAFVRAGGFDEGYGNPNVEDTAFGQKLARLGIRIRVQPELEVEHVKRYSLAGLLRTDFLRAVALTRLKLRHRAELARNNTSVPASYMASVPVALAATAALGAAAALGAPALGAVGLVALAAAIVLNASFLDAIRTSDGWGRAVAVAPLLWLELVVVGIGSGVGMLTYALGRRY